MDILITLTIIVGLTESFLSRQWFPCYFKYGIPLFSKSLTYLEELELSTEELMVVFRGDIFDYPIIFHSLSNTDIVFREKLFSCRFTNYVPVMHGLIKMDHSTKSIKLTGYMNWFLLPLIVLFIGGIIQGNYYVFIRVFLALAILFIFLMLYYLQRTRYNEIFGHLKSKCFYQ